MAWSLAHRMNSPPMAGNGLSEVVVDVVSSLGEAARGGRGEREE